MQGKKPLNIAIGRRIQQSREQAVIHLCEVLGTSTEWILRGRAPLPDSNLLAASVMEKLSGLSPAQLLLVDRMTSDLIKLLQIKENGDE